MKNSMTRLALSVSALCLFCMPSMAQKPSAADSILLKDYRPVSIFNVPVTNVEKPKYPVIDMHTHDYVRTKEAVDSVVAIMDDCGIEQAHIMQCNWISDTYDIVAERYAAYPDRFKLWFCLDYTDFDSPDWTERAIAQVEKYHEMGAVGIGEMVDKGLGDVYASPVEGKGIRLNDPKLIPVLKRCGELGLLINIHIAEPIWMYEPIDNHNDGLMNGANWQVDTTVEGCLGYNGLMDMFEEALYACPDTKIVACHLLNMSHDYPRLGAIMDRHPNLYLDISARFGESSVTPRATRAFIEKYQDRILYGTDNTPSREMFRSTFRLMETADEHIYDGESYHWSYYGWDLPDSVLEKVYRTNALKLLSGLKPVSMTTGGGEINDVEGGNSSAIH